MQIKAYQGYHANEIMGLYEAAGWTNYTDHPEMLEKAYRNSLLILGAYIDDQLIGILRAVGDGESVLLIQDILVEPSYRRKGIGSELVREVFRRFPAVYQIQLVTDSMPETIAFYESLGFTPFEKMGCCGFMKIGL